MAIDWMKPLDKVIKVPKFFGLWTGKSSSKISIAIAVIVHFALVELSMILSIVYFSNVQSIEDFSEDVGLVPFHLICCVRTLHILFNTSKIESIMQKTKELIEHENYWIEKQNGGKLKQRIRQAAMIYKLFLTSGMIAVFSGLLSALFTSQLPLKMWFPYDYRNNESSFWLTFLYQVIVGSYTVLLSVSLVMIPVYMMCYLTGLIEELCFRLEKIGEVKIVQVQEPKSDLTENEKLVGRIKTAMKRRRQAKVEPKAETFQMKAVTSQMMAGTFQMKAGTSQMMAGTSQMMAGTSQTIYSKQEKDENLEELLKCIEIQQKVNSLTADFVDVFGKIIWLQGLFNTLILCTSTFSMTVVSLETFKKFENPTKLSF
jgi:predicted phage tail protein